jgi:hypothetical protein
MYNRKLTVCFTKNLYAVLCVLLFGSIVPLIAQQTSTRKDLAAEPLRAKLATAIGADFEIAKDELRSRSNASGGGTYWLVHVKAKHSGYFAFTYRYNYGDSHYSHVEREFNLNVGPMGCRRGPPSTGSYSRFCLGDTIILPIVINNFTEHEFSLKSREYTNEENAAFEKEYPRPGDQHLDDSAVANPVSELRYLGRTSHRLLHRNGGYTLEAYTTFAAERPGRFNLAVSSALRSTPADLSSPSTGLGSVPIIIVARETPVTLLASRHEVRGYSKGYDGREWVSSTSGDAFMTELIILQPGDRIALKYHSSIRSRETEWKERAGTVRNEPSTDDAPQPQIVKRPFALMTNYDFTEWLVDYLPR